MLCALQYNFPRQYSDYRFFVVIESYNQQYTLDMKAILLEEAHTIRAASKVYQLTMVLEPRGEFTLPPIFGQPAPFLESLILKFNQTDGWYLFLLRKLPLSVCSRVSPQICAHSHWRKILSRVPHGSEHQSARSISIPKGLGPCSFSNISQE